MNEITRILLTAHLVLVLFFNLMWALAWLLRRDQNEEEDIEMNFSTVAKETIRKAIRVREQLLRTNRSLKDADEMRQTIGFLKYWMGTKTDSRSMALFVQNHCAKIMKLIPAGKAASHNAMAEELNMLIKESFNFSN